MYYIALASAPNYHRERRLFILQELRSYYYLCKDKPGKTWKSIIMFHNFILNSFPQHFSALNFLSWRNLFHWQQMKLIGYFVINQIFQWKKRFYFIYLFGFVHVHNWNCFKDLKYANNGDSSVPGKSYKWEEKLQQPNLIDCKF